MRTIRRMALVGLMGCGGTVDGGAPSADAWYDAGLAGDLPSCPADAGFFDDNGGGGYQPSAAPSGACSGQAPCAIYIAVGPFCGDPHLRVNTPGSGESAGFEQDVCECIRSRWVCVAENLASAGTGSTWCNGGPGYADGG